MKKELVLMYFGIFVVCSSTAMAAEMSFTGNVGGGFYAGNWENPESWNIFPDPAGRVPAAGDNATIDRGWDGAACTINNPGAVCNLLAVSYWYPNNSLTVLSGAVLDVRGTVAIGGSTTGVGVINNYGTITKTTGTEGLYILQFDIGAYGVGRLNMYDGDLYATYMNCPGPWGSKPSNSSHIQLDGGTIHSWDFRLHDYQTGTINGTMDITGGVLDISRNDQARIDSYVANGWLTGYGDPDNIVIDLAQVPGHMIITAFTNQAWGPSPQNGAADVDVDTALCWGSPSDDPNGDGFSYNVYYGTDPDPNTWAGPFLVTGAEPHCYTPASALTPGVEYSWRVEILEPNDPGEPVVRPGAKVWTFTTEPAYGIADLVSPSPSGTSGIALDATLQWDPGLNAEWHNVYFGTNQTLVTNRDVSVRVALQTTNTSYDPFGANPMDVSATYYWVVDEGVGGNVVAPGAVWSFTTEPLECLPPVATLDQNGDCVIDLVEIAGIAGSWLECGYNNPSYCP